MFYMSCRERMPCQLWEFLDASAALLLRFCYHVSCFPLVCNCRPVLLVAKKVALLANLVVCLLDHGEKITKWQWSEGKLRSRCCVHVPFTLFGVGSQSWVLIGVSSRPTSRSSCQLCVPSRTVSKCRVRACCLLVQLCSAYA